MWGLKIYFEVDHKKYFGRCHTPGCYKRNILNLVPRTLWCINNQQKIPPSFHEKPTNLHNLFICLSRGNLRTNKPWVFTPKKFIVFFFTPHINASQRGMLLTGLFPKSYLQKGENWRESHVKTSETCFKIFQMC